MVLELAFLTLLAISATTAISINTIKYPNALYPASLSRGGFRNECPYLSKRIDFCVPKYEDCFGQLRSVEDCKLDYCTCIHVSEATETCQKHFGDSCQSVRTKGEVYRKTIAENRTKTVVNKLEAIFMKLSDAFSSLLKNCGVVSEMEEKLHQAVSQLDTQNPLLNLTLKYLILRNLESQMLNSTTCQNSKTSFQETLVKLDSMNAQRLHIPYPFWYIGTEFGPIGKVIMRSLAYETCDKASLDFNHHSVVRVNCYDQQKDQKDCDEAYSEGNYMTLGTMDSKKLVCKMFVDFNENLKSLRAEDFYKEAAEHHKVSSTTSIRGRFNEGFTSFVDGSMTRRDTKNDFLVLEASEKLPLRLLDYFDSVSSECGASKSVVASCGFMFEYCIQFFGRDCQTRLSTCLNDINEMDYTCEDAIRNIVKVLYPDTNATSKLEKYSSTVEVAETGFIQTIGAIGAIVIGIIFFVLITAVFLMKFEKRSCKRNSGPSEPPHQGDGNRLLPADNSPLHQQLVVINSISSSYTDLNNSNEKNVEKILNNQAEQQEELKHYT
ncbi:uncharacterized protein CELE_C44H9.5 [Caenorhabditis elegans]|uniref:Uncharacterized protein n=1 Tax=Caenorhabditis elegans TaxID=6239 RepID=A0A3B1E3S9_CAEEL|nr:Uncharacterized protein CELE_C44H9.5 [Caenorhabditis elegans]VAY52519.1 Uncharacterized protein CELE_C44H9.5 [Caenorhabditis elegans]|eukprot:NP_001355437.1 Uncharacterized protein CELE_C44H9.5 [Caenorhabditis elegans]